MIKKKIQIMAVLLLASMVESLACTVCKSQQPKSLEGITHGTGPSGGWDYMIMALSVVIVLYTLFKSIRLIIKPGEKNVEHIKKIRLTEQNP